MAANQLAPILVIGYGNTLRGDDAAGPYIAELVRRWRLPSVRTLSTHQLTPELAGTLADVQHAIFVDACITTTNQAEVRLVQVTALQTARLAAHLSDPQALLALTQAAYGRAPYAWMLAIPATRFDYGAALSPVTAACITSALTLLRTLFKTIRTSHA